jgi:hypothetical protein
MDNMAKQSATVGGDKAYLVFCHRSHPTACSTDRIAGMPPKNKVAC